MMRIQIAVTPNRINPFFALCGAWIALVFLLPTQVLAEPEAGADNRPPANILFNAGPLSEAYPSGTGFAEFRLIDPDGDEGTFTLVSGDGDEDNGSFRIQSGKNLVTTTSLDFETRPTLSIRVRGTDPGGLFVERSYTINVVDEDEAPRFVTTPVTVAYVDVEYSYQIEVREDDAGDSVKSVQIGSGPSWLTLNTITEGQIYHLVGTPTLDDVGSAFVQLRVYDQSDQLGVQNFNLMISDDRPITYDHSVYLPLTLRN